jgi:hypothetical protein
LIFQAQAQLAAKRRKSAEKIVVKLEARDDLPPDLVEIVKSIRIEIDRQKGKRRR